MKKMENMFLEIKMAQKITLEARLKDKILSVNDVNINLDDSLFNVDSFNKEDIDYLELQYKTNDD